MARQKWLERGHFTGRATTSEPALNPPLHPLPPWEWFALRRWVSWLWIPATTIGMAAGLTAGAALVDYGIDRGDIVLMGAVTGVGVGVVQALVLARHRIPGAVWWTVANPPAWALGWFVSSYVITRNIDERFPVFGLSGALVFALLTWV